MTVFFCSFISWKALIYLGACIIYLLDNHFNLHLPILVSSCGERKPMEAKKLNLAYCEIGIQDSENKLISS